VKRPTIAVAVTGHGYGHAMRSSLVAEALLRRGARVLVRSEAPRWLFPPGAEWIRSPGWPLDVGVVQRDGLEMDIDTTRHEWREFGREMDRRADAEAVLLREAGVDVLLGDVPPLAFDAACRAGIPSFGVTNFTWDWIYSAWPDFQDIVARIQASYAYAQGLFRLPLHGTDAEAFAPWKTIVDVPLVARKAPRSRSDIRASYGLAADARLVLLSFGGFTATGLDLEALGRWTAYQFVLTPPLATAVHGQPMPGNVRMLNPAAADYVSLLAACDAVVTKPGYGIVADCLANRVAVLFTDRGPFREYDVLAEALTRLGRAVYVPRDDVLRCELGPYLGELFALQTPWAALSMQGADVVADRVLHTVRIELSR
jgi:UDP:flavonoid glycosyltransferase YjiC (YdhE family)